MMGSTFCRKRGLRSVNPRLTAKSHQLPGIEGYSSSSPSLPAIPVSATAGNSFQQHNSGQLHKSTRGHNIQIPLRVGDQNLGSLYHQQYCSFGNAYVRGSQHCSGYSQKADLLHWRMGAQLPVFPTNFLFVGVSRYQHFHDQRKLKSAGTFAAGEATILYHWETGFSWIGHSYFCTFFLHSCWYSG